MLTCVDCGTTLTAMTSMYGDCPCCGLVFLDYATATRRMDAVANDALIAALEGQGPAKVAEILSEGDKWTTTA